jgi:hypothetical protein
MSNIQTDFNKVNNFKIFFINESDLNQSIYLIQNELFFNLISNKFKFSNDFIINDSNISNNFVFFNKTKFFSNLFITDINYNISNNNLNKKEIKKIDLFFNLNENILNDSERIFYKNNSNLKKIKTTIIYKKNYLNYKTPIIMAGGLWSDFRTFEKLSEIYFDLGRDVFLIEITGGKGIENNFNYDFNFLKKYYLPFIINNIKNISNSSKYIYISHSNGARTFIDSLNDNYLTTSEVEKAFILGVPGKFEDLSFLAKLIKSDGFEIISKFEKNEIKNFPITQIIFEFLKKNNFDRSNLLNIIPLKFKGSKISLNLFKNYYEWINSTKDLNPGENVNLDKIYFVGGDLFNDNDGIVSIKDVYGIYNNIESSNKDIITFKTKHLGMSKNDKIINYILNNMN